ncbi:hypothetical protein GPJ56_003344 [Histomonas meleagridis]|uniref:uncharacterized protein n=1 Tax=Histomonas meleagridis TaxID=135588 RepID=UPI0035594028|nr:hypothetical protein GPJ56_003344 [Histomonas meleagridis]KAH0804963.1 hypothetical protein GO595_001908 [Histomonas meleagridis]
MKYPKRKSFAKHFFLFLLAVATFALPTIVVYVEKYFQPPETPQEFQSSSFLSNFMEDDPMISKIDGRNFSLKSFEMPLPLIKRSASESDIQWAQNFLKLPTWSSGYCSCSSACSEVSCFELVRAARKIEDWTQKVKNKETIGQIYVNILNGTPFPDRLTMVYHGLIIAITTNRKLLVNKEFLQPLSLPESIEQPGINESGQVLLTDYHFGCCDISSRYPNLQIQNASWPQSLYTHPDIAPILREHFGYHSAYFIGNFLFGTTEKPQNECFLTGHKSIVEGRSVLDMLSPTKFSTYVSRCGIDPLTSVILHDVNNVTDKLGFDEAIVIKKDQKSQVCALRKLTSANRIIHTFGSRLGFWATALQGTRGGAMNAVDKICVNMSNSQQGSLWHTNCPLKYKDFVYRTNSYLLLCDRNTNDIRLYLDYLLW